MYILHGYMKKMVEEVSNKIHSSNVKAKIANQIKRIYDWNLSVKSRERKTGNMKLKFNQDFVSPNARMNK